MAKHIDKGAEKLETLFSAANCFVRLLKSWLATRMRITQQATSPSRNTQALSRGDGPHRPHGNGAPTARHRETTFPK